MTEIERLIRSGLGVDDLMIILKRDGYTVSRRGLWEMVLHAHSQENRTRLSTLRWNRRTWLRGRAAIVEGGKLKVHTTAPPLYGADQGSLSPLAGEPRVPAGK